MIHVTKSRSRASRTSRTPKRSAGSKEREKDKEEEAGDVVELDRSPSPPVPPGSDSKNTASAYLPSLRDGSELRAEHIPSPEDSEAAVAPLQQALLDIARGKGKMSGLLAALLTPGLQSSVEEVATLLHWKQRSPLHTGRQELHPPFVAVDSSELQRQLPRSAQLDVPAAYGMGFPAQAVWEWSLGVSIPWLVKPAQFEKRNYPIPPECVEDVRKELDRLELKGKIVPVLGKPHLVNPLLVVSKLNPDGSVKTRMCIDMTVSGANAAVEIPYLALPSVASALPMIKKDFYMAKLDISDGFLICPIAREDWGAFGFRHPLTGRYYVYTHLPFGMAASPFLFCRYMDALHAVLHRMNVPHEYLVYIDDWFMAEATRVGCEQALRHLKDALRTLQWSLTQPLVNDKKTLEPSTSCAWLGLVLDTAKMTIALDSRKKDAYAEALRLFRNQARASGGRVLGREAVSIAGKLAHAAYVVHGGATFLKPLWAALYHEGVLQMGVITLPKVCLEYLRWWQSRLQSSSEAKLAISRDEHPLHWATAADAHAALPAVYTDASSSRWGLVWRGEVRSIRFSHRQRLRSINWKELYAVLRACDIFGESWRNHAVRLRVDNLTACAYVRKGHGKNTALSSLARRIKLRELKFNFVLRADYVNTKVNKADAPSRGTVPAVSRMCNLSADAISSLLIAAGANAFVSWGATRVPPGTTHLNLMSFPKRYVPGAWYRGKAAMAYLPPSKAAAVARSFLAERNLGLPRGSSLRIVTSARANIPGFRVDDSMTRLLRLPHSLRLLRGQACFCPTLTQSPYVQARPAA
jgi:hypothetical protein